MANGAIGELLTQLNRSFAQGRDFNLQAANVRASAAVRIQQFQLEKERRELEEERTRQTISASQTEQKIREFGFKEDIKAERRSRELEKIVAAGQTVPTTEEGRPFAAFEQGPFAGERRVAALQELDRPVPAGLAARVEEGALTPFARRLREAELESVEALTISRRAPKVAAESQKDRDRRKWLDPNTPEDELLLIERDLFGDQATVDGVRLKTIRETINLIYPITRTGGRRGVPEGIDPNSSEFVRHGADIVKQLGQDIIAPDTTGANLTKAERKKKAKDRGFIIDAE